MCSRAFYDTVRASGPFGRVPSVSSVGAATRHRRGIGRRDSTLRVAKHFTYEHGEKQYVKHHNHLERNQGDLPASSLSTISCVAEFLGCIFSGFSVYHVLSDKQAEHGPAGFLQRGSVRGSA